MSRKINGALPQLIIVVMMITVISCNRSTQTSCNDFSQYKKARAKRVKEIPPEKTDENTPPKF